MTATSGARCYHCQLPVPAGAAHLLIDGAMQPFCCHGCKTVAETILAGGLAEYYRRREKVAETAGPDDTTDVGTALEAYDTEAFAQQYIRDVDLPARDAARNRNSSERGHEVELLIDGMNCTACVWLIENYLQQIDNVSDASINFDQRRLRLRWRGERKLSPMLRALSRLGYRATVYRPDAQAAQIVAEQRAQLRRLGVAFIGMMQVGMFAVGFYSGDLETELDPKWDALLRWISLLVTAPIVLYSCQPFFAGAWRALKARHLNMDVPVSLSILLAFFASTFATLRQQGDVYFDAVTMFAFLLLLGRYVETRARAQFALLGSGSDALLPSVAWQCDGTSGAVTAIATAQIAPGMRLLVKPHDIIPADGVVAFDRVFVDEAAFTGESEPVCKQPGDTVLAGTVNGDTRLVVDVTAPIGNSRLQQVVDLITHAHSHKPRVAQLADRYASHFVALILLTALATYIAWQFIDPARAFWITLSVLAVSCPCALSLATPAALTAATAALRRHGILVTSSHAIEALPDATRFVFDKTGTLTDGKISLVDTRVFGAAQDSMLTRADCTAIAAALEQAIAHPIAHAFADASAQAGTCRANNVTMHAGLGVSGDIDDVSYRLGTADFAAIDPTLRLHEGHWIYLARGNRPLAAFCLADHTRPSARAAIEALRVSHRISLLTGDSSTHATTLAHELGIDDVISGATPQQKLERVRAWQQQGDIVVMIGDGINDAPVISAADVSIAVANASDIAKTQADCVLLSPQLTRLVELTSIARQTRTLIRQNLAWALAYNAVAIPAAFCGYVQPWLAAVGMSVSSLVVVLNASRLAKAN